MRPARPSPTLPHQNKGRYTAGSVGFETSKDSKKRVERLYGYEGKNYFQLYS